MQPPYIVTLISIKILVQTPDQAIIVIIVTRLVVMVMEVVTSAGQIMQGALLSYSRRGILGVSRNKVRLLALYVICARLR